VPTRERPVDRADAEARRLVRVAGSEIRAARRAAGLGLRAAGAAAGISHSCFGRIERGQTPTVSIDRLCRAASAVGLQLSLRMYPGGDAVRDSAHARLLGALRNRLPPSAAWATEVPLPIPGDLRALDARVSLDRAVGIEAETHLTDLQALQRRLALKKRDSHLERLVLLVADTKHNREVLATHREALRTAFPLDTRGMLVYLGRGMAPPADGIVILSSARRVPGSS
jgi:transcriptional regulator with XRE-family HTH domain